MNTPICDFVKKYINDNTLRLHMPGHKGEAVLGFEQFDITEIKGAGSLYEAYGIIAESEANASALFGYPTLYSTEGSSQCIRAMLYLVGLYAKMNGKKPLVYAARNAHKSFLTAVSLLDIDVKWIYSECDNGYLSCDITPEQLERELCASVEKPTAVYLTSPDYLGKVADIRAISEVCHRHGVLLAVDNAHGAYLKFMPSSLFPIDLGADICCDSAHKTLPALTGGAYLHLSYKLNAIIGDKAKNALMIFGSTSPSFLILQSLDAVNSYLTGYPEALKEFTCEVEQLKGKLLAQGFILYGDEVLKVTLDAKQYGYLGSELADILRSHNIEPEFADPDYLVLMLSTSREALSRLKNVLLEIPKRVPITARAPEFKAANRIMPIREAMLSDYEVLPIDKCLGKILAVPTVGCPPAVPILVCGEEIDIHAIECFKYYGIDNVCVVK